MWSWLAIVLLAAGLLLGRSEYEKRRFSTEVYTVRSDKIKKEKTLVFLSDLHGNCFGRENQTLLEAIDSLSPDAVLLGGDMLTVGKKKQRVETKSTSILIKNLAKRYPVYYGAGNHEDRLNRGRDQYGDVYDDYRKELESEGVIFLSDSEHYCIGTDVILSGLHLPEAYYGKFTKIKLGQTYLQQKLGRAAENRFQILLAHSPMYFDAYAKWGADLTLAGHFHGGTIRIPWLGGLMTPQYQFFYPYCAGKFEKDGRHMIVSRGLGTHSVNLRLNNRSQLVVVKLQPGRDLHNG